MFSWKKTSEYNGKKYLNIFFQKHYLPIDFEIMSVV